MSLHETEIDDTAKSKSHHKATRRILTEYKRHQKTVAQTKQLLLDSSSVKLLRSTVRNKSGSTFAGQTTPQVYS